ncbi:MAG TPA: hypothetical protein VHM21_00015 [Sphingomicrobium sp.]|jgi:preprotein translocase subunit YajC|nr:hypothetical protein [Sphingomicrobium sp.]
MIRTLRPLALVSLLVSTAALAANPYGPGWEVVDPQGNSVGIVVATDGDTGLIVRTDKSDVKLPVTSFAKGNGKLSIALNRDQLNALGAAQSSLAIGKPVKDTAGVLIGSIEALDDQFVTIKLASGQSIKLPRNGVSASVGGAVAGLTLQQLQAQLAPAGSATNAATAGN